MEVEDRCLGNRVSRPEDDVRITRTMLNTGSRKVNLGSLSVLCGETSTEDGMLRLRCSNEHSKDGVSNKCRREGNLVVKNVRTERWLVED